MAASHHSDRRSRSAPAVLCLIALAGQPVSLNAAAFAAATTRPQPEPVSPPNTPPPSVPSSTPIKPDVLAPITDLRPPESRADQPAGTDAGSRPGAMMTPPSPTPPLHPVPEVPGQFTFNFTDEIELTTLVDFVKDQLGLQVLYTDPGLKGQKIILPTPITLPEEKVLEFLVTLLEQKEFTLIQNSAGIYMVVPRSQVQAGLGVGPFAPTRIIHTPGIKPSSLQQPIQAILGTGGGPNGGAGAAPVYLDDLGIIVITGSSRVTSNVEAFVKELVAQQEQIEITPFPLTNISANAARERILELLGAGGSGGQRNQNQIPGQPPINVPGFGAASLSNLPERLTPDATSNALFFRGRPDEAGQLRRLLKLVDVPNSLIARWYPVGTATAEAVSAEGKRQQLGDSVAFEASDSGQRQGGTGRNSNPGLQVNIVSQGGLGASQSQELVGSGFVLYPASGGFMYRGTEPQHAKIVELIATLGDLSERDQIDLGFFKLKHGKAEDVAEIVQNLINNTTSTGNSGGLLGSDLGSRSRLRDRASSDRERRDRNSQTASSQRNNQNQNRNNQNANAAGNTSGEDGLGDLSGDDIHVTADVPNNQVIVKAPKRVIPQFARLIEKLDLRRPQVYIEAKIVAITSGDDFRLAVEAQQIIGQFAFNTNFGLGSLTSTTTTGGGGVGGGTTTTGGFTSPKNVATGLSGVTAALIRSRDVPFVVNALARKNDARIVATPQLLVDDNEEAEVASLDQQPTTSSNTGTATTTTTFAGFESAGPRLTVKPQISEGGYLRLEYNIELSSFQGSGSNGIPAPKLENNISADSVTVPSDMTIVVGGLTQINDGKTVVKVPLLGDIPILGNLFKDTSTTTRKTTLFIFITPRIMRDPSFADMRLLTRSPSLLAGEGEPLPPPEFERIDILDTAKAQTEHRLEDKIQAQTPDYPPPPPPPKPNKNRKPLY